jgi:hypothetical protein
VLDGDALRLTGVPVPAPEDILAEEDAPLPFGSRALDVIRQRLRDDDSPRPTDAELVPLTRAILYETVRTVREGDAHFLLVVIPMHHARRRSLPVEKLLAAWATELEVPVVNVREPLAEEERTAGTPMWAVHFSRAGHEKTARVVREKLADLGWVPECRRRRIRAPDVLGPRRFWGSWRSPPCCAFRRSACSFPGRISRRRTYDKR